jgi:hypothetical protein
MKTYVLIQTESHALGARLTEEIAALPGVHRVVQVEGPFDVVAEVDGHEESTQEAIPLITGVGGVLRAIPLHVVGDDGVAADPQRLTA